MVSPRPRCAARWCGHRHTPQRPPRPPMRAAALLSHAVPGACARARRSTLPAVQPRQLACGPLHGNSCAAPPSLRARPTPHCIQRLQPSAAPHCRRQPPLQEYNSPRAPAPCPVQAGRPPPLLLPPPRRGPAARSGAYLLGASARAARPRAGASCSMRVRGARSRRLAMPMRHIMHPPMRARPCLRSFLVTPPPWRTCSRHRQPLPACCKRDTLACASAPPGQAGAALALYTHAKHAHGGVGTKPRVLGGASEGGHARCRLCVRGFGRGGW